MTKKELMEALDPLGIEYPEDAKKDELEAIYLAEVDITKEEEVEEEEKVEEPKPEAKPPLRNRARSAYAVAKEQLKEDRNPLPKGLKKVPVGAEELKRLQDDYELVGYDNETGEAIVKA